MNDVVDYAGVAAIISGLAALLTSAVLIISALATHRREIKLQKQKQPSDDADASLKYEEAATKAAERALKLQDQISSQDERIQHLEMIVKDLAAENAQLREYIARLEATLRSVGILELPKKPTIIDTKKGRRLL